MDSINPGLFMATVGKQAQSSPAPTGKALDRAILKSLQAPAVPAGGFTAINTDSPAAYAQAAATAAQQEDSTPQHLTQLGFGPGAEVNLPSWLQVPIPHWLDHVLGGAGGRAVQYGENAKRIVGAPADPMYQAVQQQLQSTPGGKVGSLLTDIAVTAPIGMGATAGLTRLGTAGARLTTEAPSLAKLASLGGRIAANPIGRAAVEGATQGAVSADPGHRLEGAGLGAVLSPIAPLAGMGAGKVVTGLARTPEAQALLDRGLTLTPGQLKPEGIGNRLEQGMTHIPFIGGKIAAARAAPITQYTRSMLEDALAPGTKLTAAPGADFNALIADAQQGFDSAYEDALGGRGGFEIKPVIMHTGEDEPLANAFQKLADKARSGGGLTAPIRKQLGQTLQDHLAETLQAAKDEHRALDATDLQKLRSTFRELERQAPSEGSTGTATRAFWDDAEHLVTQALDSQLPSKAARQLADIDRQYSKFAIVRKAATAAKDQPHGPTPQQFTNAIAQATPKHAYAAGGGFNRDVSKAARSVFSTTIPHTGATGAGTVAPIMRGLEGAGGALFGIGALHHPLPALGAAAGLGSLWGAYSRPGLRFLAGQTGLQQALQDALSRVPARIGAGAGRLGRTGLLAVPLQAQRQGGLLGLAPGGGLLGYQ